MGTNTRMLVSLGAQKAATTWLAHYLSQHPQCAATPLKETHYFDYYDLGVPDLGRKRLRARRRKLIRRAKADPALRKNREWRRAKAYLDLRIAAIDLGPPTYEAYEALIMSAARKKSRIVGDITPANGLLSAERMRNIAALANEPLFVLTMRDPVDRTWSAIRMMAGRHGDTDFEARAHRDLNTFLMTEGDQHHIRSDYATMLQKIDAAIPAARVRIYFFEEFLNQATIDDLCDFMGVDHHPADLEKPRLPGKSLKMTEAEKSALAAKLRPVYDAVEARMGRLPDRWLSHRDLA